MSSLNFFLSQNHLSINDGACHQPTDLSTDSITNGYQSTDGNGDRLELYDDLTAQYNMTVSFIGSVEDCTMADNFNEGHDGATIDEIASFATLSLPEQPNIILVHAGTNDMNLPLDPDTAPTRLGNLIDELLGTCPDALILVAQIIPSGTAATQSNIITYNAEIPDIVAARKENGSKVELVDMFSRLVYPDDYTDDLHPNDGGYIKMGDAWYEAIEYNVEYYGLLSAPVAESGTGSGNILCPGLPVWYPQGEIANGAGLGADAYPDIICTD
jgi:lysophospholipase L1-like esterase